MNSTHGRGRPRGWRLFDTFALAAGQVRADIDLGSRGTAVIGDRVWNDVSFTGVQDGGEQGLAGATVDLT